MPTPELILYHYTSGTGLIGILEADQVWASSIHGLNDSKELSHTVDLAKEIIRETLNTTGVEGDNNFLYAFSQLLDSISKISLYISCFSTAGDSLSQWRGYCPPGFGYSIGFDGYELEKESSAQGFKLKHCTYNHETQKKIISDWATRNIAKMLPGLRLNAKIADEYVRSTNSALIDEFMEFAPYFKDRAFSDENEWRLVAIVPSNDNRLKVRASKSMLIRYLPIRLNLHPKSTIIWDIKVGPTPHPDLASNAITHYFNKTFMRGGISCSKIPYRDW